VFENEVLRGILDLGRVGWACY